MLSRAANSVYWMARYLERAENVARILDVNYHLVLGADAGPAAEQWEPMLDTTGDRAEFERRYGAPTREHVIRFLAFDCENPNSIVSCVRAARENCRSVRENLSSEMWRQVNRFFLMLADAGERSPANGLPHDLFTEIKLASQLCDGITNATMSHGEAWHFYWLGRHLERADKTARILDAKYFILLPSVSEVGTPLDELQWAAVLRSVDGLEMYRQRHGRIAPLRVVDFMVLDPEFPRAIHACLLQGEQSLHAISGSPLGAFRNPAEQRLGQLRAEIAFGDAQGIIISGLHEFLFDLTAKLNAIDDAIFHAYFSVRPTGPAIGMNQ